VLIETCVTWARIRQVERRISEDGLMVLNDRQARGFVRHPLATVANQYRTQLRFLIGELGLSPSARGRLDAGGAGLPAPGPGHGGKVAAAAAELLDG
jgi:P27 family predicted phage terminase small subunit